MKRKAISMIMVYSIACCLTAVLGCATIQETEELRGDILALKRKMRRQEEKSEEIKKKVYKIEAMLDTEHRGVADSEAELDEIKLEIQSLKGKVEESHYFSQKALSTVEAMKAAQPSPSGAKTSTSEQLKSPVAPVVVPVPPAKTEKEKTPEELYKEAYDMVQAKDFAGGRIKLKEFLEKYPKASQADNAQYWLGECYYNEGNYEEAILEFQKVVDEYPKGDKVASAILKQGFAFLKLESPTEAKEFFNLVIEKYPKSEEAKKAREKLKTIK